MPSHNFFHTSAELELSDACKILLNNHFLENCKIKNLFLTMLENKTIKIIIKSQAQQVSSAFA